MLADLKGGNGWLFQLLPDIFPEGYLTETEIEIWARYYREKKNG